MVFARSPVVRRAGFLLEWRVVQRITVVNEGREHEPPHFHAEHTRQRAKFSFDGELLAGEIRVYSLLLLRRRQQGRVRVAPRRRERRGGPPLRTGGFFGHGESAVLRVNIG